MGLESESKFTKEQEGFKIEKSTFPHRNKRIERKLRGLGVEVPTLPHVNKRIERKLRGLGVEVPTLPHVNKRIERKLRGLRARAEKDEAIKNNDQQEEQVGTPEKLTDAEYVKVMDMTPEEREKYDAEKREKEDSENSPKTD